MRKLLVALLICCPVLCIAKNQHAPLPTGVAGAKTVYIVNQTGEQNVTDGAYQEFTKWGRYSVTPNKDSADLVAVFTRHEVLQDGTSRPRIGMDIYLPKNAQDAVYEASPAPVPFRTWAKAAKACVKDFQKRVQENAE